MFWTPVFFLYLSARFTIGEVLALHALLTLRLAALAAVVTHALFLVGGGFASFAAAHVALAAHFSFRSGTEPSFHYDSLAAMGRGAHFGDREARVHRNGYLAMFVGALALFRAAARKESPAAQPAAPDARPPRRRRHRSPLGSASESGKALRGGGAGQRLW